jgi:hypothetical protein
MGVPAGRFDSNMDINGNDWLSKGVPVHRLSFVTVVHGLATGYGGTIIGGSIR